MYYTGMGFFDHAFLQLLGKWDIIAEAMIMIQNEVVWGSLIILVLIIGIGTTFVLRRGKRVQVAQIGGVR